MRIRPLRGRIQLKFNSLFIFGPFRAYRFIILFWQQAGSQHFNISTCQLINLSTSQLLTLMNLIPAIKKDSDLIKEMDSLTEDDQRLYLWWLGQSGFLLQWKGQRVLIDPYLSDSLTKKYSNTDKPHIRMSERVVDPELLKNISIVSSSHNHTDHLDGETLIPVIKNNPGINFIIPEANRDFVTERVQCERHFPV